MISNFKKAIIMNHFNNDSSSQVQPDYRNMYMNFEILSDNTTVNLNSNNYNIQYSLDQENWYNVFPTPELSAGTIIYFSTNNSSNTNIDSTGICKFIVSGNFNIYGNVLSLFYKDNFNVKTYMPQFGCCYMFENCSKLIYVHDDFLKYATNLNHQCYRNMFIGCTSLIHAPKLPSTTLGPECYMNMFNKCSSLTIAPELPATTLTSRCYTGMFNGCSSLTTAPALPATTLTDYCYRYMFANTGLTKAPELLADQLVADCYAYMFYNCTKLNYIKALFTTTPSSTYTNNWVTGVSSTGTFIKNINATWNVTGIYGIPTGWTVQTNITLLRCINLSIIADDVAGRSTTTNIYWTAEVEGVNDNGDNIIVTITGTDTSESFPQNTSTTDTIERTISYTYMGVTATTTITQDIWRDGSYTINLNNQWQSSSVVNPDTSLYNGVYESFSNKGVNSTAATMYIDIDGYTDFDLYIRSYAESSWDYVMVSQLDQTINNNTSYSNTTLIKAHTSGKQNSGTSIGNYTKVSFTGIDGGPHRITIVYRKDSSSHSGDDRGYVLIPKNQ